MIQFNITQGHGGYVAIECSTVGCGAYDASKDQTEVIDRCTGNGWIVDRDGYNLCSNCADQYAPEINYEDSWDGMDS